MIIAVMGSDSRATAIGELLAAGGHQVWFADAADPAQAAHAAAHSNARCQIPYGAASIADVVIFATAREQADDYIRAIGRLAPQTIVVDAMEGGESGERSGAETLARKLDSHRVVRALVVLPQPGANVALSSDDPDAMTAVEEMFRSSGCITTDRGPLVNAKEIEPPSGSTTGEVPFEPLRRPVSH